MAAVNRWAIYTYTLPLKRPILARGANRLQRKGLLILRRMNNEIRVGEAAPITGFHPHTLSQVRDELIDFFSHPKPSKRIQLSTLARFALEMTEQKPSPVIPVSVNGLLSPTTPINPSFSCYKIKVGRAALADEIDFLLNVALPEHATIRLDANRAWSVSEALAFWNGIEAIHAKIEYIEEPLLDPAQLGTLPLPIAIDESLPLLKESIWDIPTLSAIVLKPTLQGGLCESRKWMQRASERNISAVVSSTFESSIGIHALCNLAAVQPKTTHGLGTASWFAADLIAQRALPRNGILTSGFDVQASDIHTEFLQLDAQG